MRALQWLAQREHSVAELRARLLRAASAPPAIGGADSPGGDGPGGDGAIGATGAEPAEALDPGARAAAVEAEVETLLQWLSAHGYLDERRFVESRVHSRQRRFGNVRIRHELALHGLSLDAESREALQASELARAREVWQRKFGGQPATDAAGRVRQMRFLTGRGFSPDVVRAVVRGGGTADDEVDR